MTNGRSSGTPYVEKHNKTVGKIIYLEPLENLGYLGNQIIAPAWARGLLETGCRILQMAVMKFNGLQVVTPEPGLWFFLLPASATATSKQL